MPPKGRKAVAPRPKPTSASSAPSKPKFSAADAKKLAELQKAQKAAQSSLGDESEKKKAMRKRSAALLEKEAADQDMGDEEEAEEEEEEDIAPSHMRRANKRHRGNTRHDSSDAEPCLETVKDLLNFNAGANRPHTPSLSEEEGDESAVGVEESELGKDKAPGQTKLIDDDEVVMDDEPSTSSMSRTSKCSSVSSSKVTLFQFTTPRTKRIASIANRSMRRYAALVDSFPSSQQKESKAWDIIVDSCKGNDLLTERLTELQKDLEIKNILVNYTWQGMSSLRAELILKARQGVPTWYGLTDLEIGDEGKKACKWLLKDNVFLYGDISLKERLFDKNKPWMHHALVYLISEQFWSVKGDAIKMGKQNNSYLDFPDALLALCATVIQCALRGFCLNGKVKGGGSMVPFTDESYRHEFATYKTLLLEFKSDTPTFYKLMKMDMKAALRKLSVEASSMLKKTGTIMKIDKEAVEEAAKRVLAERETAMSGSEIDY